MRKTTRPARRATATKVIASVALVAGAASVAGMGTFGAFTDTTTADQEVTAGTIALDAPLTISDPIEELVPGDTVQRAFTLTRAGNQNFGSLTLSSKVEGYDSIPGIKPADIPKLSIDQCAVPWVEKDKKLTCGSDELSIVNDQLVTGPFPTLADVTDALNDAGTSYLRVQLAFPNTEEEQNHLQGKSATLKLKFDATQRAGESR